MARKLRIAVSVLFGLATMTLCVLWVRSYWRCDTFARHTGNTLDLFGSNGGDFILLRLEESGTAYPWGFRNEAVKLRPPSYFISEDGNYVVAVPIWIGVVLASMGVYSPWLPNRFSLRTLLIATTLLAVVLGLGVWLARQPFPSSELSGGPEKTHGRNIPVRSRSYNPAGSRDLITTGGLMATKAGIGMVIGAVLGILADAMMGSIGIGLVFGAAFGIVFGAAVAKLKGTDSTD